MVHAVCWACASLLCITPLQNIFEMIMHRLRKDMALFLITFCYVLDSFDVPLDIVVLLGEIKFQQRVERAGGRERSFQSLVRAYSPPKLHRSST